MKTLLQVQNLPEYNNEYTKTLLDNKSLFDELFQVCCQSKWSAGTSGSYLIDGTGYEYYLGMYNKQKLLFDTAKNSTNVLEIGTYIGHSLLIMLLSNPRLNITCVDLDIKFPKPATQFLQEKFTNSNIKFFYGNSLDVVPSLTEKYDLFHIDGNHSEEVIKIDFENVLKLAKDPIVKIIFDDVGCCWSFFETLPKTYQTQNIIIPESEYRNAYIEIVLE